MAGFGTPAISDLRHVVARATIQAGRAKLSSVYLQELSGAAQLLSFQGASVPGIAGAAFKSFRDPVISPVGKVAFVAKVTGVSSSNDEGIWTNAFGPELGLALREGQSLDGGVIVNKITSVSVHDGELLALLTLRLGGSVNASNDTALIRVDSAGTRILLREGALFTTAGGPSPIKSITVLSPAPGSVGHGRWHGDGKVIAKIALVDKREEIVGIAPDGTLSQILESGDTTSEAAGSPVWATFGRPALDSTGAHMALLGTLANAIGGVTDKNNAALAVSLDSAPFALIAREGATAPDAGGAMFSGFLDPVINDAGRVLFQGTLNGAGVSKSNKTALWWGVADNVRLLARVGGQPTNREGVPIPTEQWAGFDSHALRSGVAAGPIVLARVKGTAAPIRKGVWMLDSGGLLRGMLRTGDQVTIGSTSKTVKSIALLDAPRTAFGTTRSFNATGSVAVLATFTDKSQALLRIDIP
jgi:hypothetical protein